MTYTQRVAQLEKEYREYAHDLRVILGHDHEGCSEILEETWGDIYRLHGAIVLALSGYSVSEIRSRVTAAAASTMLQSGIDYEGLVDMEVQFRMQ